MRHWFLLTAVMVALSRVASAPAWDEAKDTPLTVWLPYAGGVRAVCGQGPNSNGTHKGLYAWDFTLDEGKPVVAAAPGRVLWLVDGRTQSGRNNFHESNHIFMDIGGGRFFTYSHHKSGTARVRTGDLVAPGTHLADVGKVGTIVPHIHFDLRGPSWHQSHDARFRTAATQPVLVREGQTHLSATARPVETPKEFRDSVLQGDEFAANGVKLTSNQRTFWLPTEKAVNIDGRVLQPAKEMLFFLWQDNKTSEYVSRAVPDAQGRFQLAVRIPRTSQGPRWYRITIRNAMDPQPNTATLPVMVE